MRVLHVYGGNLYGGVERLQANYARYEGMAPGLEQVFGLCYAGRLSEELSELGARVHWLGGVRVSRWWQVLGARRRLRRYLAANHFDAAVCHSWWPYAIFGPALRAAGVPVALWVHENPSGKGWLERWALRRKPELLFASSGHVAQRLPKLFPGMEAVCLAMIVPAESRPSATERAALRRRLNTAPDAKVVVQVCRLERWKGHHLLLAALGRLATRRDWTAWIVGGPQRPQEVVYEQELKAEAEWLGISGRVRWPGSQKDVAAVLGAADIFCHPNTGAEPFGSVFLEALACGLPVVATRMGGAMDIVTPECGILAEPTAEGVANGLATLLDDEEKRTQMGLAGPRRAHEMADPGLHMGRLYQALQGITR